MVLSSYNTQPKLALESLASVGKVVPEMLQRPAMQTKEAADVFKMILFPVADEFSRQFPPIVALPQMLSEVLCKGYLKILEKIATTPHELAYVWMNTLKHLLLLIDKAHQAQAVEYIETAIERIKSVVLTMLSMKLLSIVADTEDGEAEGTTPEKQLSVSSWKAIDAFLPDLKGEVSKQIAK